MEKRPVIWSHFHESYLFVDDGVFRFRDAGFSAQFHKVVWTLVDSGPSQMDLPQVLIGHNMPFFIIFATSPTVERWSNFDQAYSVTVVVMNPWTRAEIHRA